MSDKIAIIISTKNRQYFILKLFKFSYLGSFLKLVLPCRRELKIQGPGVIEIAKKTNKN